MTDIENTSAREPIHHMFGLMGGSDAYIYGMEAAGQRQFVKSDYLPTQGNWEAAKALGVVRGPVKEGDELFTHVTLPEGWRREGTEHDMHSNVLDERGVPRIAVFYKAAFYDRRADFNIVHIGQNICTQLVYGDELKLPDFWRALTDEEKQAVKTAIEYDIEQHVTAGVYGDPDRWKARLARNQEALTLVESAL